MLDRPNSVFSNEIIVSNKPNKNRNLRSEGSSANYEGKHKSDLKRSWANLGREARIA